MSKNEIDLKTLFPIFNTTVNTHPFTYLDSASTAGMPQMVIDAMVQYYATYKSNVGRGLYRFAEEATQKFEDARKKIARFIGANDREIIFSGSATNGINMVALIWAQYNISSGDEIIVSEVEHHANFVPWQQLAIEKGAILKIVPVNDRGVIDIDVFKSLLSSKTKFVSIVHQSNILGTTNDIVSLVSAAHVVGAKVLVDAAQSIAHQKIDVKKIKCDFLVFSGHKLFGPTGIGVLYVQKELMLECKPYLFGGGMVYSVTPEKTEFRAIPHRFEAGTQPIAQAIGLSAALDFINQYVDFEKMQQNETELVRKLATELLKMPGISLLSPIPEINEHSNVVTFIWDRYHAHDIAAHLDQYGIAVRAGHHCVQPYHYKRGINASVRVSFSIYNSEDDVKFFVNCLKKLCAS